MLILPNWFQKHFFGVNEIFSFVVSEFKIFSENDCSGRTCVLAISAKNTAEHVDFVPFGVPFAGGESGFVGVFGGLDINASRRTCARAEGAADTSLESVIVACENVSPTSTRELLSSFFRILNSNFLFSQPSEGDSKTSRNWFRNFF